MNRNVHGIYLVDMSLCWYPKIPLSRELPRNLSGTAHLNCFLLQFFSSPPSLKTNHHCSSWLLQCPPTNHCSWRRSTFLLDSQIRNTPHPRDCPGESVWWERPPTLCSADPEAEVDMAPISGWGVCGVLTSLHPWLPAFPALQLCGHLVVDIPAFVAWFCRCHFQSPTVRVLDQLS